MRKRIRFHIGTAELMGYVVLLGQNRLEPGQTAFAQIRLEEPAFALPGDRFIIRQYSPMLTIGGGQILDSAPLKHRRNDKNVIETLRVFKEGSIEDQLMTVIEEAGLKTVELLELSARRGLPAARAREYVAALVNSGRVRVLAESPYIAVAAKAFEDRKSTRLNSSHTVISYAVFCLKKKKQRHDEAQQLRDSGAQAKRIR